MIFKALLTVLTSCVLFALPDGSVAQPTPPTGQLEEDLHRELTGTNVSRIRSLLDAGANINARDILGGTALHIAANFRGDTEVLKALLDKGADINAVDKNGLTPLLRALSQGHYRYQSKGERLYAVAALFLERGASVKVKPDTGQFLREVMDPLNLPLMRLLIQHGATPPDDALHAALSQESIELVRLLMQRATPAMLAAKDPFGGTLLHRAAEKPSLRFAMEWLLVQGFDVNALDRNRVTPFGRAVFSDNLAGMTFLVAAKAGTDMISGEGKTALHLAAYGARLEVLRWLVARGMDIKARDESGRLSLDIAFEATRYAQSSEAAKLELIALLGGTPADMKRGRYANHPLHVAVNKQDLGSIEHLLEAGESPNLKDGSGNTPLYWALVWLGGMSTPADRAFGGKLLPLLLRHGADTKMIKGGSLEETYEQYARTLRIGDVLEKAKQRYAPRSG